MKRRIASLAGVVAMCVPAACNLWPAQPGQVDLPFAEQAQPHLLPRLLESDARAAPQSLDEGLEALRNRPTELEAQRPALPAAGAESLSIEAMRLLLLRGNLSLDVALYDPAIARARVGIEEGKFDAAIGAHARYAHKDLPPLDGPLVSLKSEDPALDGRCVKLTEVEQEKELVDLGLGVTVPLPTGGSLRLEGLVAQQNLTDPQRFEQYVSATRFSISQPLLRGAGTAANEASIRMARVDERVATVRTKLAALQMLARAEKAYWQLYGARRLLDVRVEQARLANANLNLVRRRVEQGITPGVEVTRAQMGSVRQMEALIVAETMWRLRQRQLKALLASERFPLRGAPMIETTSEPRLVGYDLDAEELAQRALRERLDLIELELTLLRDSFELDWRQSLTLPLANLEFRYGTIDRDQGMASAIAGKWDFDHQEYGIGLTFEVPFTNQRRRAERDALLLQRARRFATKDARALAVRQEVYDSVDLLGQNWQRILAARQSVIVAGANYDAEFRQFEQGMRTMREVFEALTDLGDAQRAEISAIVDYQVAQVDLAFATGTLLGYARVDLSPLVLPTRGTRE
ncbi:MAG: TolC family protein [Planctomycetota bacterium]